jgi:hypothetical protein
MTMFPMLDDPNPPVATSHTLTRVHTRARILRRRRRIAAAAPAVLAVGVAGAIAPRLRAESPEQVATITSSTLPPATGFGLPTTTLPFDDRGEVFRLSEVPAGWELSQERIVQVPEARYFERMMGYRTPNPVAGGEPYRYFTVYRYEASPTDVELKRQGVADEERITTPGGREAFLQRGSDTLTLTWIVNETVYVEVNSSPEYEFDVQLLLDSLEYTPPSPSCFQGDEVRSELAACGALEYETP